MAIDAKIKQEVLRLCKAAASRKARNAAIVKAANQNDISQHTIKRWLVDEKLAERAREEGAAAMASANRAAPLTSRQLAKEAAEAELKRVRAEIEAAKKRAEELSETLPGLHHLLKELSKAS